MLESKNANKEAAMSTGRYPVVLFMRSPLSPPAPRHAPPDLEPPGPYDMVNCPAKAFLGRFGG